MSSTELQTATLRDDAGQLEADFLPEANMLCCSLRHRGVELLAQNAGVEAYVQRGKTMGIPLLYPWANRLAGFRYAAAGEIVTVPDDDARVALDGNGLPIHGLIGGRLRWELAADDAQAVGADAVSGPGGQSLTARLRFDESLAPELFAVFPFAHEVRYRARLTGDRLEVEIEVRAGAAGGVPVAFGFHPYLALPGESRERWQVELPAMCHLELDAHQIPTGAGAAVAAQAFTLAEREFDDGFDSVRQPARFAVGGGGRELALELLEGYPCAQVYAPPGRGFICFEPMTAPADALASGRGLRVLGPGECHRARFALLVSETGVS